MIPSLTISPDKPDATALDFEALRAEGIDYLEKIVGELWSDYNLHDPGITLLELLCYGITDISYRTSFPDADLFAKPIPIPPTTEEDEEVEEVEEDECHKIVDEGSQVPFVTARHALTNEPVTLNDYRRLILDAFPSELRNVWFEATNETLHANTKEKELTHESVGDDIVSFKIHGLYHIRLLYHQALSDESDRREEIKNEIRGIFHCHRNLCEDLLTIEETATKDIMVCADIQLAPDADIDLTYALIIHAIQEFLNPAIPRHSLAELVELGYGSEEIFDGPPLENGFILESDLDLPTTIKTVRTSDLIAVILAVPGVVAIPSIYLNEPGAEVALEAWELEIPGNLAPKLKVSDARLHLFKDVIPFDAKKDKVLDHLMELQEESIEENTLPTNEDFAIPEGEPLSLDHFTTLQEALPATYNCGSRGLNRDPSPAALAKAKQLQAFLLIFDQILANYLGQLTNLTRMFSAEDFIRQSFFANPVSDLPELASLLKPLPADDEAAQEQYLKDLNGATESTDDWIANRSALFDHILARFGETFTDYILMSYGSTGLRTPAERLDFKRVFLNELPVITANRGRGYKIYESDELWDTHNVAGLQHRVSRLLGFDSYKRRNLSDITYEFKKEEDVEDESEIRFRIVDPGTDQTIFSGTNIFLEESKASEEMGIAINLGKSAANYRLENPGEKEFYLTINNEDDEILAKSIQLFLSEEEAIAARDQYIEILGDHFSEEGMFLIEHLLLRPRGEDWNFLPPPCEAKATIPQSWDPYSFRLHFVLPGWGLRLEDVNFRHFVSQTIRRELPAHLSAKICFIGRDQMEHFEVCYLAWLENLALEEPAAEPLNDFLECLDSLYTIFPSATLHDCAELGVENNPVVLGRTIIGSEDCISEPEPEEEL